MQGRRDRRQSVAAAVALATAGMMTAPVALADSSAAERIRHCPDGDWCAYHRTVDHAWRYSPLAEINKDNVSNLHVAWIFQPGRVEPGSAQHAAGRSTARCTAQHQSVDSCGSSTARPASGSGATSRRWTRRSSRASSSPTPAVSRSATAGCTSGAPMATSSRSTRTPARWSGTSSSSTRRRRLPGSAAPARSSTPTCW